MNEFIDKLKKEIEPYRQEIIHHKVYGLIKSIEDVEVFMRYHVFAVWDFMSLLKTLQNNLTCTTIPWYPKGGAKTRRLINEIVVAEECDMDENGYVKSHFELYLDAMTQCGADTTQINEFIRAIIATNDLVKASELTKTPHSVVEFVQFTFKVIESQKPYLQSAIFTFGREDLIPNMFLSIIKDIQRSFPEQLSVFKYYLERHIEVDGGEHSHLALEMTAGLCGDDETIWEEVSKVTIESLERRIGLWDGIYDALIKGK